MFEVMYFRGQRVDVIIGLHLEDGLRDQGTCVELGRDPMDTAAMLAIIRRQCPRMGVKTFMTRQQRGMDVEQTTGVVRDKVLTQDAHKAR